MAKISIYHEQSTCICVPGNLLSHASRWVDWQHVQSLATSVCSDWPSNWGYGQQEAGVPSEPVEIAEGLSLLRLDGDSPSEPEMPESVHLVTWTRMCAIMLCRGAALLLPMLLDFLEYCFETLFWLLLFFSENRTLKLGKFYLRLESKSWTLYPLKFFKFIGTLANKFVCVCVVCGSPCTKQYAAFCYLLNV